MPNDDRAGHRSPIPGESCYNQAQLLRSRGLLLEALHTCLAGLRAYPEDHGVRFILARVLFELGYLKLAAKELLEVKRNFPNDQTFFQLSERLERLLSNQPRSPQPVSTVLAEAQVDLDEIAKFDQSKERK